MQFNLKYLIFVFICVGGYKISSVPLNSNEENFSLLITNQSYDVPTTDYASNQLEFQRKSSTIDDDDDDADVRSEALIKKIHPFIYPKQFNTLEGMPTRRANTTSENLLGIRNLEALQENSDRIDETYGVDHKHHNIDLIPLPTHLHDVSKHGHFHNGYFDRPHHSNYQSHNANQCCLLGLLQSPDLSLVILGVLGFVAYLVNAVVGLVDRLNLPLLSPGMAITPTVTNAATTKTLFQRQTFDDRTTESHQKLLKDFERILQMAIEVYEQKLNSA